MGMDRWLPLPQRLVIVQPHGYWMACRKNLLYEVAKIIKNQLYFAALQRCQKQISNKMGR
jgi:hypothetical protein